MASTLAGSNVRVHDRFFFSDDSLLYLLVENSLYCIHKFLFEIHASMFPVRELETSMIKPYILEGVKKIDFDRLLASLYPRTLGVEETETTQDWISVLRLASKWGFNSLRSKAISKIEQTLDSSIDMVTLGRQYGIPDVLLPGYAILCQSTIPLSFEEGLRLGMKDVVNIYRIRHALYGSGITPVPLDVAFAKVKESGLGGSRPKQEPDSEQASTWMAIGSVTASQSSTGNGDAVTDSPPLNVASTDASTLMSERHGQCHVDAHLPSDKPTSVALGNGGNDMPSSLFPGNGSDLDLESTESDGEGFKLLDEFTNQNFDLVSVEIMQWVNTKDIKTLHQITQLIVERAIEAPYGDKPYPRLCKAMMKYTQTLHRITRLIAEKAIAEPHRLDAYVYLCNMMIKGPNNVFGNATVTADGLLFGKYLGQICQENLEAIVTSVAGTDEHKAKIRGLRLIEFVGALTYSIFDLFSGKIMQWVNMKDIQTLHQITRLIVEKAIKAAENPSPSGRDTFGHDPFAGLCKAMVKYAQTLQPMTRLIVEMAMEEPGRISACVQLCEMIKGSETAGRPLFDRYLGEICQQNLEAIAASVTAGELTARVRRLRLIEFIGALVDLDMWAIIDACAPTVIDKWMTALLDANDEEKVATLCMVMTRVGRLCTSPDMNSWLQRVKNVAQETSKPRVQKLLQEVIKHGSVTWVVAKPSEGCVLQ